MLKDSISPRLLKKVQMQGGARGAGYPPEVGRRRTLSVRRSAARARQRRRWAFFSSLLGQRARREREASSASAERR